MKIDVLLQPSEITAFAQRESAGTLCVVFDVLRATSCMLTGLHSGVRELFPVSSIDAALELRAQMPEALLGGERGGEKIEGFDLGNTPFEYQNYKGKRIITTTTNGTVALQACAGAGGVLVGAVVNVKALVNAIDVLQPEQLVAVCAGTGAELALEDVWAAGALLGNFRRAEWTDAAHTAHAVWSAWPEASEALRASKNGRVLLEKGREADVEWCAKVDRFNVVGWMEAGAVRKWNGEMMRG